MKKASLTMDLEWILGNDIYCFDLVRGMDYRDRRGKLVFADIHFDEDVYDFKRQSKIPRTSVEHGGDWYCDQHYNKDYDFRATKFLNAYNKIVTVRCFNQQINVDNEIWQTRRFKNEVLVNVDDGVDVNFSIVPNQALIRSLLVLVASKRSSNPMGKLPIEMFRLLKVFLEKE